jgi:hypothetical protein
VAVAVVSGAVAPGAAAATADGTDGLADSQVTAPNATVEAGEQVNLTVVLAEAPDGLAGYELTLALGAPGVANVTGVEYPARIGLTTDPRISADGQSVTVEAADLNDSVGVGASNVTLATVAVTGDEGGSTPVTIEDAQVDADGGDRIAAGTNPEAVTVEPLASESTDPGADEPANPGGADDESGTQGGSGDGDQSTSDDEDSESGDTDDTGALPLAGAGVAALAALVVAAVAFVRRR